MSKDQKTKTLHLFLDEFSKESERAKVILSAAMLDEALFAVLKVYFVPNSSSNDSLFDGPNAPMSVFSSRIDFAYRLGLISKRFSRDLHIIRRIRNEFAHNVTGCSFNSSNIRNQISALKGSFSSHIQKRQEKLDEEFDHIKTFEAIVAWSIWYLWGLSEKILSQIEPKEEWAYNEDWPKDQNS